MEINFIQISDLHHHYSNYDSDKMRLALFEYLKQLSSEEKFDFITLTGDIAHQGGGFGKKITGFLDTLISSANLTRENVYIIPGNHDLKRDDSRSYAIGGILKEENSSSDELDASLQKAGVKKLLLKSYNPFFRFYKSYLGKDYPSNDLHHVIQTPQYNIVHINTCLVACKSDEEGTLLLGKHSLLSCLEKIPKDEQKLNIAIGHHTPKCLNKTDEEVLLTNFEDYGIDIYLSGHVHEPGYESFKDYSGTLNVVSGAGLIDNYANGGFVTGSINLENGETKVKFHSWNKTSYFWTVNNNVGRKTKDGVLKYTIERLKKKNETLIAQQKVSAELVEEIKAEELNEDEFKQFIIDFHNNPSKKSKLKIGELKKKELEKKFTNMKCSETFELLFLEYAQYFFAIEEILNSTAYVERDKKEIVAEMIIEKYLDIHNHYNNGDEIFNNLVKEIQKEYENFKPYSPNAVKRYIRILVSWSIYDCGIFNDDKNKVY